MKLIDKERVVAEIEKRLDKLYNILPDASKVENGIIIISDACNTGKYMALESFRKFLDTIEVKEVDLEKEFDNYTKDIFARDIQFEPFTHLYNCAKHFFELGLKAKKGK